MSLEKSCVHRDKGSTRLSNRSSLITRKQQGHYDSMHSHCEGPGSLRYLVGPELSDLSTGHIAVIADYPQLYE